MGSVGAPEILVILVLALLVLGPERLPQAARTMGRWVGEARRITGSLQAEVQDVVDEVMRPVNETATAASQSFTSTSATPDAADVVEGDGAATAASPSSASGEAGGTGDHAHAEAPRPADVPLPGLEPARSLPVPPVDPSLN